MAYKPPHLRPAPGFTREDLEKLPHDTTRAPDIDQMSVATSAFPMCGTAHSNSRSAERNISNKDIQTVFKHGEHQQQLNRNLKFEHAGIVVITLSDKTTVVTAWREAVGKPRLLALLKALDGIGEGKARPSSQAPFSAQVVTKVKAIAFMKLLPEGRLQMHSTDVPTFLLDQGCGFLEQALQFGQLTEPCWTPVCHASSCPPVCSVLFQCHDSSLLVTAPCLPC